MMSDENTGNMDLGSSAQTQVFTDSNQKMMSDENTENVDLGSNVQKITGVHAEAASSPAPVNSHQPQSITTTETTNENGKKKDKPQGKVSPFNNMHHKLNFIPHNQRDKLNAQFLATLPGVLKLAELALGFVAFILAICADRKATSSAWAEHITFETTIVVAALLIGYTIFPHLTLQDERTRNSLVFLELLFYGFNTGAYFIAVWLMVHLSASWTSEGRGAAVMCAIVCVALTVLYGIESFVKFKLWKGEEIGTAKSKVQKVGHATMVPGQQYEANHELKRDAEVV